MFVFPLLGLKPCSFQNERDGMRTYIEPHMTKSLSKHELKLVHDSDRLTYYVMSEPGTGIFLTKIVFVDSQIVITGDIIMGHHRGVVSSPEYSSGLSGEHLGAISDPGYSLDWFSGYLSESYLCEKFLNRIWQKDAAKETILDWINNPEDYDIPSNHIIMLKEAISQCYSQRRLYDSLYELSPYYVDDGIPGYDYPRADAGWLCVIQKRFAELYNSGEVNS